MDVLDLSIATKAERAVRQALAEATMGILWIWEDWEAEPLALALERLPRTARRLARREPWPFAGADVAGARVVLERELVAARSERR